MTEPLKVIPKSNPEPGMAPLPAELVTGELAVNTADAVLYTKLADGTVAPVCCGGSVPTVTHGGYFTGRPCGGGGGGGGGDCGSLGWPYVVNTGTTACNGCFVSVAYWFQVTRCATSQLPAFHVEYSSDPLALAGFGDDPSVEWTAVTDAWPTERLTPQWWQSYNPTPEQESDWQAFVQGDARPFFEGQGGIVFKIPSPNPGQMAVRVLADAQCLQNCVGDHCAGSQLWTQSLAACESSCDLNWGCAIEGGCVQADCAVNGTDCFATQAECEAANCGGDPASWRCIDDGPSCLPAVNAPDNFYFWPTESECLAHCGGDPLSYRCIEGACQAAFVEPDYVTYFPTESDCQSRCGTPCGASHTAVCVNSGIGYAWQQISAPANACQFSTMQAGWDGSTPIYGPQTLGHDTGPSGEMYAGYGDTYCRWLPIEPCGPCSAENEGANCTINCTTYNPAP